MISMIYFDIGDVIFDFRPNKRLHLLNEASSIPKKELQHILFDSGFSEECDKGLYSSIEMHQIACDRLGWRPSYQDFQTLWVSAFEPNHELLKLAKQLCTKYKLGLLSNNPPLMKEVLNEIHDDIEKIFSPILFSGELKIKKPNKGIFFKAAELANCPVEEILFIDDTQKYVEAAKEIGFETILYSSISSLVSDMKALGIHIT